MSDTDKNAEPEQLKPSDTTPDGLDTGTAEVVETLPCGREIRRMANRYFAQSPTDT